MTHTNGQRVAHKTLGKLLALGALAGVYCFATAGAAGVMMAATDMSAQAAGHGGHGGGHGGGHFGGHGGHGGGHFWHGRWWLPGEGSCWRGPVWICD
jgi:hypothetical protein